ncbi:conserved hypothetical protein [Methanothermobacter sp. CaT2]|jgi:hypothetical protein|nr:conserved hypothetical protein [Methanothermobacter sp. CaT2]
MLEYRECMESGGYDYKSQTGPMECIEDRNSNFFLTVNSRLAYLYLFSSETHASSSVAIQAT